MKKFVLLLALTGIVFAQHNHTDANFVEEDAHMHGVANLQVVVDNETLLLDFISPAVNLIGFEYAPKDDHDIAIVEAAMANLNAGDTLFMPNRDARCNLVNTTTSHQSEMHDEGGLHSEFVAAYEFNCNNIAKLDSLDVSALFELYSSIEDLDVQYVLPTHQGADELNAENTTLNF